ncbi:MAG: leucyl aminopeptidase family protein [Lysobacterales bacterium]|jgi:leucyl aminopeptidase
MNYISVTEDGAREATVLKPMVKAELESWLQRASDRNRDWVQANGFKANPGQVCVLPDAGGGIEAVLFGMQAEGWLTQLAAIVENLPEANYRLESDWTRNQRFLASLGWGLACYRFDRYKDAARSLPSLVLDEDIEADARSQCMAQALVRDLINTPTENMGPADLASAAQDLAQSFGADFRQIEGDRLLAENFPAVHVVGRAAERAPRLIELTWGDRQAPLLALVGKGVCFDTGGLNLKPAAGMLLMKKDMGGAAHVLALARLVMENRLPVRLLVLVPAVENAVSGNAYRPGDVVPTRKGLSVEIGNTDAEGRVILSDALAYACEQSPDLVIDFATLTGAARVALGPDLPPVFSNRDDVSQGILQAGLDVEDPLWPMPLHRPYNKMIESPIADLNNAAKSPFAGCITAALFLEHFVEAEIPWVHIDTFGWSPSSSPARPEGGEALGMRAVWRFLERRYA